MVKSPEILLAEMEYIQSEIDSKEMEIDMLKRKLIKIEKELALSTRTLR